MLHYPRGKIMHRLIRKSSAVFWIVCLSCRLASFIVQFLRLLQSKALCVEQ